MLVIQDIIPLRRYRYSCAVASLFLWIIKSFRYCCEPDSLEPSFKLENEGQVNQRTNF